MQALEQELNEKEEAFFQEKNKNDQVLVGSLNLHSVTMCLEY